MNIPIKMSKDFEKALTTVDAKYGEDFELLNGFHESQLNFSDFIDGFVDKNVADVTIDGNANASHKDICSMLGEKGKSEDKLFAFNKIFYELKKKYGLRTAKEWLDTEYSGGFYLHDAPSSTYKPYCFSGDTKILTKNGIKELKDLVDTDIQVLNKNHGWENATVKCFGKNKLRKLTLERFGKTKEIMVTGNHIWFVKDKTNSKTFEIKTDDLKEGMRIPFNTSKTWSQVTPSPFGVAHGFFTGDGDKGEHMRANFCGDKEALIPYFTPTNITGSDKEKTTRGIPNAFRNLPSLDEPLSYLYGWLSGYFAADGNVDEQGRCTLSSTVKENLEFVREVLCVLGMPVNNIRYQDRVSNLTNELGRVYVITLSAEYLKEDFFIRPLHKKNFELNKDKPRKERYWLVKSVEETDREEDVYCAVVEGSESFTLDNNVLTHNCYAYDLSRLATEGLFFLNNYNNEPPKHLTTFLDDVIEFVSFMSNRTSGACGLPNILLWTMYFAKKDNETGHIIKDYDYYVRQNFQKFIYRLNQPFLRVDQSAFTNVSIFDRNYYEALFGGVEFPDGSFAIDYMEDFMEHQKTFMEVVSEIRSCNMFTFPVLTYSLLYKDGKFVDEPFARWCSNHNMLWNDSNFFMSDDVTTLSNCPLSGDTKILYWSDYYKEFKLSPIAEVHYNKQRDGEKSKTIQVLSNGKKITCKINQFDIPIQYRIELANGAYIETTANHLNKVLNKDYVETKDLTTEDYLPYSTCKYEEGNALTYEEGKLVGMFLGDGSYRNNYELAFSLNRETKQEAIDFIYEYCQKHFNAKIIEDDCVSQISGKTSCVNICVNSNYLRGLISQYVIGDNALNKQVSYRCLNCSVDFRRGIIDGLYMTDGGNNNRIYTSSKDMSDSLVVLFASLGMVTNISEDNREGRLGTNTNYVIRFYEPKNRTSLKDVYILKDGYMWFKIKSITKINPQENGRSYCLEVLDDNVEPIFMLGNGVITHNCRLLSDSTKLGGFINSIGGTALSIGSVKVNTINLMRIAYESEFNEKKYLSILKKRTLLCCKTLDVIRHIITRNVEKGLLPNYCEGGVDITKQYSTVGILGLYEVIEAFGLIRFDEFGNAYYTDEGMDFAVKIFDVLNEVKDNFTDEYSFNIESVPAERAAVILCQKDNLLYENKDKFIYSNQWIPLSQKCTIQEKLRTAAILDNKCSGGAIAHINLEANFPNEEMAWDMLNKIAQSGVIYFAFNTRINSCKNRHGFVGTDICPVCGEGVEDTWQRIVGFFEPTSTYSKERKKEFSTRQWYDYANLKGEI